jgi:hypothetical protein
MRRRSNSSRNMRSRWRRRSPGHEGARGGDQGQRGTGSGGAQGGSRAAWSRTQDSTRLTSAVAIGERAGEEMGGVGRSVERGSVQD